MALLSHFKHPQTFTLATAGQNPLMAATQHHVTIIPNVASLGKDKNVKCELWLLLNAYCFPTTTKSKNCKLKHCKLEPCVNTPRMKCRP